MSDNRANGHSVINAKDIDLDEIINANPCATVRLLSAES